MISPSVYVNIGTCEWEQLNIAFRNGWYTTGKALIKPMEYFDYDRTPFHSRSKGIYICVIGNIEIQLRQTIMCEDVIWQYILHALEQARRLLRC